MKETSIVRGPRAGFTMVELLVVIAILATLAGLGVVSMGAMQRKAKVDACQNFITLLGGSLEQYRMDQGSYPPTTLADYAGVGTLSNFENAGIESLVLCLTARAYMTPIDLENMKEMRLENLDQDQTSAQITRGDSKDLWEILDPWGTPLAYFHSADYGRAEVIGRVTGDPDILKALPHKNAKLKSFAMRDKFQILSAGPDRVFNTEDDVTNFTKE